MICCNNYAIVGVFIPLSSVLALATFLTLHVALNRDEAKHKQAARCKENLLLLPYDRRALLRVRQNRFSILARTRLRGRERNASELYIVSTIRVPWAAQQRKNQLYPSISIGLNAKMSTLYCCHRHIIRDIGTFRSLAAAKDRPRIRADRGREADRATNPRTIAADIERAFTSRPAGDAPARFA